MSLQPSPSPQATPFSELGAHVAAKSGIESLMDDLGNALAEGGGEMLMLGGGNPAHIPEMEQAWAARMHEITQTPGALRQLLGVYDPPRGNARFLSALAALLRREYGWPIGPEHLAITNGGQTAFYCLFNLLAGRTPSGEERKILLPVVPEYIGYANQGFGRELFHACRPRIEETGPHRFKYRVDFDQLETDTPLAAICVSRPTNPTGNVLDDGEMARLSALAKARGIPLIVDNAYGHPFPSIIFDEVRPAWDAHHILVLSLSKLGLPGTRTAIVVAPPTIASAVASMTAVMGLANNNLGQALVRPLVESGELLRLSREVVRPYYLRKRDHALAVADAVFPRHTGYALHESGGALFLWLWLRGCPISSREVYERLKARKVVVVPGEPFFFGLGPQEAEWPHRHECLRISYAMEDPVVEQGLAIIGEEMAAIYS